MKKTVLFIIFFSILLNYTGNAQQQVINNNDANPGKKKTGSIIPPQISYPPNNTDVNVTNPVFVWVPPRPSNANTVTYCIRLVEVHHGETPTEALLQNPPLLNLCGLTNTFLSYPLDAPSLKPNTQYAWQIGASSGGQSLGAADVSLFSVKKDETDKSNYINYPVVAKANKEHYYISHGIFYFAYENTANENTLSYTIKSSNSNQTLKGLPEIKLRPGMNKLNVNLKETGDLKNNTYYYLEIKNKQQQIYKLIYYYIES